MEKSKSFTSKEYTLFFIGVLPVLAGATIAPALPEIAKAFPEESELSIQLILTITALLTGIGSLFVGNLIDKYGRRKPLILAIILYGFSGSSGLYLNSVGSILIGRAIFGIAVAGVMTISVTLIGDYYQGEQRNKVVGMQATFMTFSGVFFIFLGGVLAEISWHLPFALYLLAFVFLIGVITRLDEPDRGDPTSKMNLDNEHERSLKAHTGVFLFVYTIGFVTVMIFYFLIIFLPFYFVEELGRSPSDVGIALSVNSLIAGIVSLNYKRLKSRYHYHGLYSTLFIFMGIGAFIVSIGSSLEIIIIGLMFFGVGVGLFLPNTNNWLFGQIHAPIRGRAIGGLTTAIFLGQFVSPITGNLILGFTDFSGLYLVSALILVVFALTFFIYAKIVDKDGNFDEQHHY
ncbi:MAG: MFS transporter [Candidatus Hodarchaeales archaeon]|jgi:MFS family permease